MRLREFVVTAAVAALVIAGGAPASAAGSDGPPPYAVTSAGITLPAGDTFPDGGHVNVNTSAGSKGIHFESLNQADDSVKKMYIGAGSIPWSAFGIDIATTCVTWVQISMYAEHYGEGGQPGVGACGPQTPPDDGSGDKKITFCHATGSEGNPYVTITTSLAAFYQAGHINDDAHHSGVDIYPAGSFTHPTKGTTSWPAQGHQSLLAYEDCAPPVVVEPITPPAPVWVDTCEAEGMWTYTDTESYTYSIGEGGGMITVIPLGDTVFTEGAVTSWPTPDEDEGLQCDDGSGDKKITFCHATGSESNPYVTITTSLAAFYQAGHINDDAHHSGVDIYPAGSFTHPTKGTTSWPAQGHQSLLAYEDCAPPVVVEPITPPAPVWVDTCEAEGMWTYTDTESYTYSIGEGGGMITVIPLGDTVFTEGAVTSWPTPAENEGLQCENPPQIYACVYAPVGEDGLYGDDVSGEGNPRLLDAADLMGLDYGWTTEDRPWFLLTGGGGLAYALGWDEGQTPPTADDCFQTAEVTVSDFSGEAPCEATEYTQTATQLRMVHGFQPVMEEGGVITILQHLLRTETLEPVTRTVVVENPEACPTETEEPTLDAVLTPVCEDNVPYLDYELTLTDPAGTVTATTATLTFTQGDESLDFTVPRDSGRITWPGYESEDGEATAWPGYELVDGIWENVGLEMLGWTRDAEVTITVNPSVTQSVTYPSGAACAPVNPTVDVIPNETTTPTKTPTKAPAATPVAGAVTYTG